MSRTIEADTSTGQTVDLSSLQATARVSGRVLVSEGDPAAKVGNVNFVSTAATTLSSPAMPLQKDGTFSFREIQAGTYRIRVNLHSGGYYVQKVSAKEAKVSGREIAIAEGSNVDVTIVMGRGQGRVTGVVQSGEKPVAGAMVLLVPESGQELEEDSRMDESDSDGTFSLGEVLPGEYVLLAIKDGWDLEWAEPGVLKPYLPTGQRMSIAANQSIKMTVPAQAKAEAMEKKPQ